MVLEGTGFTKMWNQINEKFYFFTFSRVENLSERNGHIPYRIAVETAFLEQLGRPVAK